jgi:hypothetical protein
MRRELTSLLVVLARVKLEDYKVDGRRWKLESSGAFSCQCFYRSIIEDNSDTVFECKGFTLPPKIKILGGSLV